MKRLDRLIELYKRSGFWSKDRPVKNGDLTCSKCRKGIKVGKELSFTISELLWKPFRFQYHEKCLLKTLKGAHKTTISTPIKNSF